MRDIALAVKDIGNNLQLIDIDMDGHDLATDDGLQTAIIISLFTDRRADPDDELPDGTTDRRGWWGDSFADIDGDLIGSRRWLLAREKQTPETARRCKEYDEEALQWLIDDGIAQEVIVTTEWLGLGVLGERVEIIKPDGSKLAYKFDNIWEAITNAV